MKLTDKVKTRQRALRGNKKKKSRRSLVLLGLLAVISCLVYFRFIEPRLDARKFKDSLKEFGAPELEIPREAAVTVEEIPYRTGKVLVVIPEHTLMMLLAPETIPPQIHPAWFKLKSSIRASRPQEVDTLIRISKELRGARLYREIGGSESKVAAAHRLHIDVYNWHNETYIGRWTLDPGYFSGDIMTSEELDKMTKATNNSAVLKFIESMPERRSYLIRPLINSSRPTSLGSLPCLSRA
jgi:hypothetical protein